MKKRWLIPIVAVVILGFASTAFAIGYFESQTGILYSGNSNITDTTQPIGTGYTQQAQGMGFIETQTQTATVVFKLNECTDGTYSSCVNVANSTGVVASSTTGNEETSSTFQTFYTMISSKYYELEMTSGGQRVQCGNTSAITPIAGADATPTGSGGVCAGSGRSWYFKLYGASSTPITTSPKMSFNWIF